MASAFRAVRLTVQKAPCVWRDVDQRGHETRLLGSSCTGGTGEPKTKGGSRGSKKWVLLQPTKCMRTPVSQMVGDVKHHVYAENRRILVVQRGRGCAQSGGHTQGWGMTTGWGFSNNASGACGIRGGKDGGHSCSANDSRRGPNNKSAEDELDSLNTVGKTR